MKRLGITEGEYFQQKIGTYSGSVAIRVKHADASNIDDVLTINGYQRTNNEINASVKLALDAFNTANKCDMLPSELLEQRNELLEFVQMITITTQSESTFIRANELIKKATEL